MASADDSFHVSFDDLAFPVDIHKQITDSEKKEDVKSTKDEEKIKVETNIKEEVNPSLSTINVSMNRKTVLTPLQQRTKWMEKTALYVIASFCNRKSVDVDSMKNLRAN